MKINFTYILDRVFRGYVAFFLLIYGTGKIFGNQFYLKNELPENVANATLGNASAFDLAWTFMGFSYTYILFIGISQIVGAFLLLFEKTKLLGVAILLPILLNIVVFDMIFLDEYGALMSASIYTIMLVSILFLNKTRVWPAILNLIRVTKTPLVGGYPKLVHIGLMILVAGLIFGLDQFLVNLFGYGQG